MSQICLGSQCTSEGVPSNVSIVKLVSLQSAHLDALFLFGASVLLHFQQSEAAGHVASREGILRRTRDVAALRLRADPRQRLLFVLVCDAFVHRVDPPPKLAETRGVVIRCEAQGVPRAA